MTYAISQRRLRSTKHIRELLRQNRPTLGQMMQPIFVVDGIKNRQPVPGMTGVFRETPDTLLSSTEKDLKAGVSKFLLFPVPQEKHTEKFHYDFACKQIENLKREFGDSLWLSIDVCLCSSTSHGQCGIVTKDGKQVDNAKTVAELARQGLAYAQAGADCVAPSDMMDHRVAAMREALDNNQLERTLLMSYSAKFHSKFYGPFREAADSAPKGDICIKDRATYQIDPGRYEDALKCSLRDAREGADILMVKPGMPYLDVLYRLSQKIKKPWAVYQVSGEYASIEMMAEKGLINREPAHIEAWTAFLRAGAQIIITYGAREAKNWLANNLGD